MTHKKDVRKFDVKAKLGNFQLAKAKSALRLRVYSREVKVGERQVGRGSLYWWGRSKQIPKRVSWGRFTEMMNRLAYGEDR